MVYGKFKSKDTDYNNLKFKYVIKNRKMHSSMSYFLS